ncbi:threonine--tRNA ligase [Candidatus Dependentiae bacterium]|nr:threonine--tRNA ligase [Candidatus Dependentiae bacterium]
MEKTNDIKVLRHSAAHLLAHALIELFPDTQLTLGPATEEGFFYDVLPARNFKEDDLVLIEERMRQIVARNLPLEHADVSKHSARELYKNNPFKLELIDNIPGDTVGLAVQGDFKDLCRGGHVASTGDIQHFKLLGISGSYWRADKKNQALQRIHGTAFFTQKDLEDADLRREELLKYDHRKIGKQLDMFSFHEEGVGFPFFHPKGKLVINTLITYMRKLHVEYNYQEVSTPTMLSDELWRRSGHYAHYKENMYFTCVDDQSYAIKPMNCPGSILIYRNRPRSYRELPLKLAEFGHVHRHELSGVLHGLLRVRAFTQDDAHIYCTLDQIEQEIKSIMDIAFRVLKKCEFTDIKLAISTKPEKAIGSEETWQKATDSLKNALDSLGHVYTIAEGDGAFYGPKIEIMIKDSMGRQWTCGTAQVDFFQSENFDLSYVSSAGVHERPVIIHQAIYGSLERFFAILLEHYKGHLPFWVAPVQARVLTITDAQKPYAEEIVAKLKEHGLRVEMDKSSDPISAKIKDAQIDKIPWMLVLGQKEVTQNTVTLRLNDGTQQFGVQLDDLIIKAQLLNAL